MAVGNYNTREWYMDGHGHVLGHMDQTENPLRDHVFAGIGDDAHLIAEFDADADKGADIFGVTEDGGALVRSGLDANGNRTLNRIDLKNGTESILFSNPKYDAGEPATDPHIVGDGRWSDRGRRDRR